MNQSNFKPFTLTPGYISGLTQADGSFSCTISLLKNGLISFIPVFDITADLDSKHVLYAIQAYFGCGIVKINPAINHSASFQVTKKMDLINIIIPHFLKHPVFCSKLHAFNLFHAIVVELLAREKGSGNEGKLEIVRKVLSMNEFTSRKPERIAKILAALGLINDESLDLIKNKNTSIETIITFDFIAGMIDGDGSFFVSFEKSGRIRTGFGLTCDTASLPLLNAIREMFKNVGSIQKKNANYST